MKTKLKKKMADKKNAVKTKMAVKKAAVKARFAVAALVALDVAALVLCDGCALERADPKARSGTATYTITVTAAGEGSTAYATITDGMMLAADGEGAVTQPSTLTTEQSPDITMPGDALSAGIQAVGHVVGKGIDAYTATHNGASGASGDCPDGNCGTGDCAGGKCLDSAANCPGGNCIDK